jgi:hypothetical protein
MRSACGRDMGVVLPAQDVRSAFKRVMANPPTSLRMAVDLPDARVDADRDRGDERRLTKVGAETGPEVVIRVRSTVGNSGVKGKPVPDRSKECDEKGEPDDAKHEGHAKADLPGRILCRVVFVGEWSGPAPHLSPWGGLGTRRRRSRGRIGHGA